MGYAWWWHGRHGLLSPPSTEMEGPGFLPGLFSCPEATQNAPKWSPNPKRAFAEIERPRTTRRGARAPLLVLITARPEFRAPWSTRSHHTAI